MTVHRKLDDEARDKAALHALGAFDRAESLLYEAHLTECSVCLEEVRSSRVAVEQIALLLPSIAPSTSLRARVLDRVRAAARETSSDAEIAAPAAIQTWKSWVPSDRSGFSLALAKDAVWEPTGVEGVEARRLYVDPVNDRATMLIRMAPGTSYPSHSHANAEECYVILGDLRVDKTHLAAGDYQRASCGSVHPVQSTDEGCLLLIVSSLHDELLPQSPT